MGVSLAKGQKIDLTKREDGKAGLSKILVGLGWDEAQRSGGLFGPKPIDCDASVILCGANGKAISSDYNTSVIYFGNLRHPSGAISHMGDNLTGAGDGDDEQIVVDLNAIPSNIEKLVFVVNIYNADKRKQHFGMINNAFIRLEDMTNGIEFCRFNLSDNYGGMTGLIAGEIYRNNGEWKFNAIGQGVQDASRIVKLLALYV